jgi:hypothetical protein
MTLMEREEPSHLLLRQPRDVPVVLDQALDDVGHEATSVVAEPANGDVFGEVNQSSAHSMIGTSRFDPDEFSAIQPDDNEGIEQVEADRRDDEEVILNPSIGEIIRLEIVRGLTPSILQRLPASR